MQEVRLYRVWKILRTENGNSYLEFIGLRRTYPNNGELDGKDTEDELETKRQTKQIPTFRTWGASLIKVWVNPDHSNSASIGACFGNETN